jgi:hypothetical protein
VPWFTVSVLPAICSEADRAGPSVADTVYDTAPLPLPLAPPVILTHETGLDADQLHPLSVATVTRPFPPAAGMFSCVGLIEYVQPAPCATVTLCPAMLSVALRAGPVFAAAASTIAPAPAPDAMP